MKYDFVAFGDIVIDAFIRLKDARVNCDINDEHCIHSNSGRVSNRGVG